MIGGYVLTFAALLLLAGSMARRFGARTTYQGGLAVFVAASAAHAPLWGIVAMMAVVNLAAGLAVPAMTSVLIGSASPAQAGLAGAALSATRQVGALVGIAAAGAFLQEADGWGPGVTLGFILMLAAYAVAAVIAWRIRIRRPADGGH